MDFAQDFVPGFATYLANLGGGASLGLSKYPAALALKATRAVTDGAPLTWEEAIAEAAAQQRAANEASPNAAVLGDLSGGLINAAVTGGAGIPQLAVRGAATGAIRGFTANEGMEDAALNTAAGAGLGALLGGAAGGADKLLKGATKIALTKQAASTRKAYEVERDAMLLHRDRLNTITPSNATEARQLKASLADINQRIGAVNGNISKLSKGITKATEGTPEADALARKAASIRWVKDAPLGIRPGPLMNPANILPGGTLGALAGGTGALVTGNDPVKGALYGAVGGGSLWSLAPRIGVNAGNTAAGLLGKVGITPGVAAQAGTAYAVPSVVRQVKAPAEDLDALFNSGEAQTSGDDLDALFNSGIEQ